MLSLCCQAAAWWHRAVSRGHLSFRSSCLAGAGLESSTVKLLGGGVSAVGCAAVCDVITVLSRFLVAWWCREDIWRSGQAAWLGRDMNHVPLSCLAEGFQLSVVRLCVTLSCVVKLLGGIGRCERTIGVPVKLLGRDVGCIWPSSCLVVGCTL